MPLSPWKTRWFYGCLRKGPALGRAKPRGSHSDHRRPGLQLDGVRRDGPERPPREGGIEPGARKNVPGSGNDQRKSLTGHVTERGTPRGESGAGVVVG